MSAEQALSARAALDGEYEILRELGVGGTAVVYLARKRSTGEEVAIKLIRATFLEDEEALARFAREARYASRVDHPNVVPIREVVPLHAGGVALVMAHVPGQTLTHYIHEHGRLPVERAERILRDAASGLNAVHALDIVHRDVKPENIFIDESGDARLADFGLARSSTSTETQLTMTGVAVGTPTYMPPEQIDSAVVDARGDIYSLGLVFWQMLTGKRPWDGEGLYALLYHQKHDYLPDVREFRPDVPDRIADVIATATKKDPEKRWQNVGEMVAALDGVIPARRETVVEAPDNGHTVRVSRMDPGLSELARELETGNADGGAAERTHSRRSWVVAGTASIAALLIIAIVAFIGARRSSSPTPDIRLAGLVRSSSGAPPAERADTSHLAVAPTVPAAANSTIAPQSTDSATGEIVRNAQRDSRQATPLAAVTPPSARALAAPVISASPRVAASTAEPAPALPATPPSLSATHAIVVAGGMHTCLIAANGRGYCLGANSNGQLGSSSSTRAPTLAPIGGNLEIVSLAAGLSHTCAIVQGGAAWCWGDNNHGQLGDHSTNARGVPVRVADSHLFHSIVAGAAHTCALDANGTAWCWGAGNHGQLGNGSTNDAPAPVSQRREQFSVLTAGWNHTCALDAAGKAYCWGDNASGQLGTGDSVDRSVPAAVATSLSFTSIAAGASHTCAVTAQGEAYCWGKNSNGQLGDGTIESRSAPALVKSDARFTSITAGAMHTCAIDTNGQASCWGLGAYGQLGDGSTRSASQPVLVAGGHRFSVLRAFGSHTCGSTPNDEAFCWGYNLEGQLGDGTRTNQSRPVYLAPPPENDSTPVP